jgi:hypothetical protein
MNGPSFERTLDIFNKSFFLLAFEKHFYLEFLLSAFLKEIRKRLYSTEHLSFFSKNSFILESIAKLYKIFSQHSEKETFFVISGTSAHVKFEEFDDFCFKKFEYPHSPNVLFKYLGLFRLAYTDSKPN